MGILTAYSGDWDRGVALAEEALTLNPHHPGWYRFGQFWMHYRKHEYPEALSAARMINMPTYFYYHATLACAFGQLGRIEEAQRSVQELLKTNPDFPAKARAELSKWNDPDSVEHFMDGLRKAGLEFAEAESAEPVVTTSRGEREVQRHESSSGFARPAVADSGSVQGRQSFWIAVLPFKGPHGDAALETLSDGLTEDITTGLSRFPYLQVIAHNSALAYKGRSVDIRTVGRELGARYVLGGSARKAGSAVRVSAQIVDAASGAQVWAEAYDRDLDKMGMFAVQDEVIDRVVATVADPYGVLVRSMALAVRDKPIAELTATELVLRFFAYWHQIRPEEHARLRAALEQGLEREPAHADAWACLSRLYSHEHQHRLNPLPDSVERARKAARRAVELDPTCQMGWEALADASYFARDLGTFRTAAERAMSLNPRNTSTVATMAMLFAFGGEWERGVEITRGAMALNPHHPGWYHFVAFYDHYRKREYEEALETTKRINMPEFFWTHVVTAAVCGRLGQREEARAALEALRSLFPDYRQGLRANEELWILDADVVEQVMQGLAEAETLAAPSPPAAPPRIETPMKPGTAPLERKAIAILPFANMSADADNEFFTDGMTEAILARVSTVKDLRVISRTSVMVYKRTAKSIREIAQELNVGTVLEGSVRRAGNKVRIVAQLIEAATDKHLWAGTYDRDLNDVFAIQSDVAEHIAAALQAELAPGVVERMRRRPTEHMDAYDLFLRARQNIWTLEAVRLAEGLAQLESAIKLDAGFAAAHAMIAIERVLACYFGGGTGREEMARGMESAERAIELDETCALAWAARGTIRYHHDWDRIGAERDLRKAVSLDPNEALAQFFLSIMYFMCERFDEALTAAEAGTALDPHSAVHFTQVGYCQWLLGKDKEAERTLASAIDRHPSDFNLHNVMGVLFRRAGRFKEAAGQFEAAARLARGHPFLKASQALCLRLAGDREGSSRLLAEVDANPGDPRINDEVEIMLAVARSGKARGWLTDLQAALDRRSVMAPWWIRVLWESVGDPPRNYSPQDFRPIPRDHPDVLATLRRLWPDDFPAC
jgi:TolB-like protein/Flp pilus assembly protein TadD